MICNKDCEHCPYPDCINDEMDWDDYEASAERDKLLKVKPSAPVKPKKESYYKMNREACLARCKEHYRKHPEKYREYRKKYYAENRERLLLRQRRYYRRKHPRRDPTLLPYDASCKSVWRAPDIDSLRCITYARIKRGLSQSALAKLIGVTYLTVSHWEKGVFGIAHMDGLLAVMPELKEMIGTKCEDFCDRSANCDRQDCYYSHIKPRHKKESPPADVRDRQAEGVSHHLPHDIK